MGGQTDSTNRVTFDGSLSMGVDVSTSRRLQAFCLEELRPRCRRASPSPDGNSRLHLRKSRPDAEMGLEAPPVTVSTVVAASAKTPDCRSRRGAFDFPSSRQVFEAAFLEAGISRS